MRFGVPLSRSPSPVRRCVKFSTYGLYSSSSSSEDDAQGSVGSDSDFNDDNDESSSLSISQRSAIPLASRSPAAFSPPERHHVEDTVAAIRLRTRHHDPYEEWEKQTRKDAFHTARREHTTAHARHRAALSAARARETQQLQALSAQEVSSVSSLLSSLRLRHQTEEKTALEQQSASDKARWARIEATIQAEEEKVRVRQEAERKAKEEEERREKEAALKRELEEKKKREEEEKEKRRQEEEREKKRQEEEEARKHEEEERRQAEELQKQEGERMQLGMTTPDRDWREARHTLKVLKGDPMRTVKADPQLKKLWNENRRKITPRIGQLTKDDQSIVDTSQHILQIFHQNPALPRPVYFALLSSLSKAFILQAETEVTAEKRSARPLAFTAARLVGTLDGFADVLWAKLVQRTGGWCVPCSVPSEDSDGTPFDKDGWMKAKGRRNDEGASEFAARVAGIMRVYFWILHAPVTGTPLFRPLQRPKFWAYFARMISQPRLLAEPLAAELLSVALDVGGAEAKYVWGKQWVKMLELLYDAVTGEEKKIGGTTSEGHATRVRLQLEIERAMVA
ncbi:GLE1-like protein-domain-containing protein [Amylostereum chailletii]|nr:GLE1-like protein-domain-containing protein [Amylostereum chailletii]